MQRWRTVGLGVVLTFLALSAGVSARGGGGSGGHGDSSSSSGTVHVSGYTRKDGTSVQPYDRAAPGEGRSQAPSGSSASATTTKPAHTTRAAYTVPSGRAYRIQDRFTGQVVVVHDGDTITVLREGKAVKVRLYGIDAPEEKQAFGAVAKRFTARMAFEKTVTVLVHDTDRYGRLVGEVLLPDGHSLNESMVRRGVAWWYKQYAPEDTKLAQLERDARAAKRGLWSDPRPVPPWEFREP